jgi:hypothetical protein
MLETFFDLQTARGFFCFPMCIFFFFFAQIQVLKTFELLVVFYSKERKGGKSHIRDHGNVAPVVTAATPKLLALLHDKTGSRKIETKTQNKVESDFFFRLPRRRRGKNNVWEVVLKFRFPHCLTEKGKRRNCQQPKSEQMGVEKNSSRCQRRAVQNN